MEELMYYVLFIFAFLLISITIIFNILTKQRNKVEQAKSGIDVYLKQRFDLIPNLSSCVKAYMEYESEVLI
jgi:LemA protein